MIVKWLTRNQSRPIPVIGWMCPNCNRPNREAAEECCECGEYKWSAQPTAASRDAAVVSARRNADFDASRQVAENGGEEYLRQIIRRTNRRPRPIIGSKYENGKIYAYTSSQTNQVYIGSCVDERKRDQQHRRDCKKWKADGQKSKWNQTRSGIWTKSWPGCASIQILKYDDAKMIILENYPCKSSEELRKREQYWMNQDQYYNKLVNKRKAYRSEEDVVVYQAERLAKDKALYRGRQFFDDAGDPYNFCEFCFLEGHDICCSSIEYCAVLCHFRDVRRRNKKWPIISESLLRSIRSRRKEAI